MANPSITFNTGSAVTLTCVVPRFGNWSAATQQIGPSETALGTGLTYRMTYRTDYCASFEFPYLTIAQLGDAIALKTHLENGGSITVTPNDSVGSVYTCYMWPGRPPEITLADRINREYTMTVYIKNAASTNLIAYYL